MILSIAAGFALLFLGGELLVRGSVSAARQLGVSPLLIGVTLVGFGTSTPELVTSIEAALRESPGIAVGNVVGSNIANVLLILGAAALIAPISCDPRGLIRDGSAMVVATLAGVAVVLTGTMGRSAGFVFIALLVSYITAAYLHDRKSRRAAAELEEREEELARAVPGGLWLSLILAVAGIATTVVGARFLVDGAIGFAVSFGISETVIGLSIVAVGTSLPELATSLVAAARRHGDIAFGNILGSNVYNIFGILGITAAVHPLTIPPEIIKLDIWVMAAAAVLLIVFALTGSRISRSEGAIFLGGYAAYLGYLAATAGPL